MGELQIEVATEADDERLRALCREVFMPGDLELSFQREPNFFHALGVEGSEGEVLIARDGERAVGVATRASRERFVNGERRHVSYLSMLRVAPDYRRRGLTRRGFLEIRRQLERREESFAISTIICDNKLARVTLERKNPEMPLFAPREKICTIAAPTWHRRGVNGIEVRTARDGEEGAIAALLQEVYRRRQFAPVWSEESLRSESATRGLSIDDFLVVEDGGELVGVAAVWDQGAFKQTVVRGYGTPLLRYGRGAVNLLAPMLNTPLLPPPGSEFRHSFISHLAVRDDDEAVTLALLARAHEESRRRGSSYVAIGLSERDPRLEAVQRLLRGRLYWSMLYTVAFDDSTELDELDDRVAHLEVAAI